ncbi:MAG: rhomboid family intramembrane serine protease [Saprospiraceae bacterium]|nr:rhomboid family intramembrane serine protease [Saprospiraceae bacterium]
MEYNYLEPTHNVEPKHITFWESLRFPLYFTIGIWFIHLVQVLLDIDLGWWGIYPREAFGLRGILFAPLLHSDWGHLTSNSVPFLVCATMIVYFFPRVALRSFMVIYFVTGFCVWVFARTGVFHIGLSYVVYGLVSFIFWTGVFRRSLRSIILSLIIVTLYSGMFSGVLPTTEVLQRHISWESHLIGAIIGIITAYFYKEEVEHDEFETPSVSDESKTAFLAPDVFDKTKAQRLFEEEERRRLEQEERMRHFPPFDGWTSSIG